MGEPTGICDQQSHNFDLQMGQDSLGWKWPSVESTLSSCFLWLHCPGSCKNETQHRSKGCMRPSPAEKSLPLWEDNQYSCWQTPTCGDVQLLVQIQKKPEMVRRGCSAAQSCYKLESKGICLSPRTFVRLDERWSLLSSLFKELRQVTVCIHAERHEIKSSWQQKLAAKIKGTFLYFVIVPSFKNIYYSIQFMLANENFASNLLLLKH